MIGCDQVTKMFRYGRTVPERLLQEALVIFVFKQISQFRSLGCEYRILCSPGLGTTSARGSGGMGEY